MARKKRSNKEKELMDQYRAQIRKEVLELPKLGVASVEYKKIQKETDDLANLISKQFGVTYKQFEKIINKVQKETIDEAMSSPSSHYDPQKQFAQNNAGFDTFVTENSIPLAKIAIDPKTKVKERTEVTRELQREAIRLIRRLLRLHRDSGYDGVHTNPNWFMSEVKTKNDAYESRMNEIRGLIGEGAWEEVRMQNMRDNYNKTVKETKSQKPFLKPLIRV